MMPNMFRVEVADNGFVIRYDDPEVMQKNRDSDDKWEDPERTAVFKTVDEMKEGLNSVVETVTKAAAMESEAKAKDFMGGFEATMSED